MLSLRGWGCAAGGHGGSPSVPTKLGVGAGPRAGSCSRTRALLRAFPGLRVWETVRVRSHRWEGASGGWGAAWGCRPQAAVGVLGRAAAALPWATCRWDPPARPLPWLLPGDPGLLPALEVYVGLRCSWCVCCVQRPLPPALGVTSPLCPPGSVGPVPRIQEGGRTSRPCSSARAGQGWASRPLAGPSPGQEPPGLPQPEELSGHPVGVAVGEARSEGGGCEPHGVPALQDPAGASSAK